MPLPASETLISTAGLSDEIVRRLRRSIARGEFKSGEHLKQIAIADRFGVSAVPVREAFQRLAAEGLVIPHRNKGVVVTPLTEADFIDIVELRMLLEPQALRLSAANLTPVDLDEAEAILAKADRSDDPAERSDHHWSFHRHLYSRAERPRLLQTIETLYAQINRYLLTAWTQAGLSPGWSEAHGDIVEALRHGDVARAADMVRDQASEAADRVLDYLRTSHTQVA